MASYSLARLEFEDGSGFVVARNADGQRLQWRTLPRKDGLESVNVVGERFYGRAIQHSSFAPGQRVALIRQPENPHDSNAVAIFNGDLSLQVGFVPREDAKRISRAMDRGVEFRAYSIWEVLAGGERVQLRILLLKTNASIDLSAFNEP